MTQTRIDQFYKVASKKSGNTKNNVGRTSASHRFGINGRKGEISLGNLEAASVCKKKAGASRGSWRKRIARRSNISISTGTFYSSKVNMVHSPIKTIEAKTASSLSTNTPTVKQISPTSSPMKSPVSSRSSNFTPKFTPKTPSPIKEALESPRSLKMARRKLFSDRIEELMPIVIDNLNQAKERAIANNDINLEKVYSSGEFNYKYNRIDTTTSTRYEINDIIMPTDTYSRHFFSIIASVFSKPFNCGYFNEYELDLIFSLLTISKNAQALMIRMLKRKHIWHRTDNIKYDNISTNLSPVFDELVSRSIFKSNAKEEDMTVLLKLLQVEEIRKLCQEYKVCASGRHKKEHYVQSILKFHHNSKPLFPGMPNPVTKLRASVNKILGCCVLIDTNVSKVIDKIITLLVPNQDPQQTMADLFNTLVRVEMKEIKYPEVMVSDFPIFANKEHLSKYMEAKSALCQVLYAIEKKQWDVVRQIGSQAEERLSLLLGRETQSLQNSKLPRHIRHFMPCYMWLKVLSKSIDAFKKSKETLSKAIKYLRILVKQKCHMKHKKGQWYNELIKIQVYHMKDPDGSVKLLSKAVEQESLTEVDRLDLLERAENLAKRKSNIDQHSKDTVKQILGKDLDKARLKYTPSSITIQGTLCRNLSQRKSTWCINEGIDKEYGTVESLALYDYKKKGYVKGVHCEGAFPVTLLGTLFWDEIYNLDIPGACVSPYEPTPLDLFTSEFYENRREHIDKKLQAIRKFDVETLGNHLKQKFDLLCEYTSICQGNIFDSGISFQEVALCLGVEGVVGICERLIHNYTLWRAGFPDLIVWNPRTKQYKIVEVKGPGDSLSTKQKLWLQYLNYLGLNTEVCYCESKRGGRKRKHECDMM
ncbi:PREDICTED: fanconi-associated nuclease 1-like isoform X2 [Dinoponera quadriceps]|uniref:Fanconi-associated nuclease n=1 Tax=Dinoponera quadriceps TaxID=609295 RepID=A0A6P3X3Q2_DINQU|nr:PREDICTED: fanconi-associated nuclease 1-like isoform X2 [Dinoponera quadriceps]